MASLCSKGIRQAYISFATLAGGRYGVDVAFEWLEVRGLGHFFALVNFGM